MVCSIIAVILLGFFLMTALLGAALCGIVDGVGDALCQSEQEFRTQSTMAEGADPTCCFQCPGIMSTCEGKGCLYYPIEAWQECNVVCTTERDCSNSVTGCTDTSSDCKSTLGSLSTRFSDTSITLADCTGFENNADVASTSWDAQSNPAHCGKPSGLVATDTPSVAEQAAVGCTDDEHATETDTACANLHSRPTPCPNPASPIRQLNTKFSLACCAGAPTFTAARPLVSWFSRCCWRRLSRAAALRVAARAPRTTTRRTLANRLTPQTPGSPHMNGTPQASLPPRIVCRVNRRL